MSIIKTSRILVCTLTGLSGMFSGSIVRANELLVYPAPPVPQIYNLHNDDFTVRVRENGGAWHDLYEYRVRVDWDNPQSASMVYFDFQGPIEIEILKNNGAFRSVSVAPLSSKAHLSRRGDRVVVNLTQPENFSLQFDDDRLHNLHILTGAPPATREAVGATRTFAPGIHVPPAGTAAFPVQSGDRIYLEGGAILLGAFDLINVHDVKISGRGLLYDPGKAIDLNRSTDVAIQDLILVNTEREAGARFMNVRNSRNVQVRNVGAFTAGKWADGINISTSQHVSVDNVYLRTSDDAVVIYAVTDCPVCKAPLLPVGSPGEQGSTDTFDIRVTNSRLWNDVAHALYVGHFGDLEAPRTIRDIVFDNIDVANLDEDDPAWEGAMAIFSGDRTLIQNVTFSNIRVDRIEEGKLIHIVAGDNPRYNKAAGRGIDGVTLREVRFTGRGMPSNSIISGMSDETAVKNVRINHLMISGRRVGSAAQGAIKIGPHVEGVSFR